MTVLLWYWLSGLENYSTNYSRKLFYKRINTLYLIRFTFFAVMISQLIALWYIIIYNSCKNFNYRTLEALNSIALIRRVYRKYMWHENMFQEDITVLVVFRPSKRSFCCRTPIQATFNVGFKMGLNLKLWTSYFTIQARNSINSSDPLLRNLNNKMILFPLFLSLSLSLKFHFFQQINEKVDFSVIVSLNTLCYKI